MSSVFLHLSEDWALGHDHNQWILYKRREKQGFIAWRPVAFIATNKLVLHRVVKDLGCCPTANAQRLLDQLPDTFSEWIRRTASRLSTSDDGEAVDAA